MILRAIGRLILVPLGLLLGVLTSLLVLLILGLEVTSGLLATGTDDAERIEAVLKLGEGLFRIAAAASIVPALLVVIVGEVGRIRSVLYYVAGGGAAVAVLPLLARFAPTGVEGLPGPRAWAVLATAGFAGGLVYWLIAGRRA